MDGALITRALSASVVFCDFVRHPMCRKMVKCSKPAQDNAAAVRGPRSRGGACEERGSLCAVVETDLSTDPDPPTHVLSD